MQIQLNDLHFAYSSNEFSLLNVNRKITVMHTEVTSCVKRLFFTLGKTSCWLPEPSQPSEVCFRLLESCRQVTAPSSECFSADLDVTEQSRASSSFSVSTFTLVLGIFTGKREGLER